jgi:hypothetical protein
MRGMEEKIATLTTGEEGTGTVTGVVPPRHDDSQEETSGHHPHGNTSTCILADPTRCDYLTAMFFIAFGIIAAVAGLFTNIYVIVKGIDVAA